MTAIPAEKLDKLVQRWTAIQSELNQGVDQVGWRWHRWHRWHYRHHYRRWWW